MVLGIDLGTNNTVAASLSRDGRPVIIPDAFNKESQTTPSIALIEGNRAYAGNFADNLIDTFPTKKVISFFKRSFGTSDPVYLEDNNAWFSESVAALILKKVKYDAEMYLPDGYNDTVITVPAHYNDVQRKSVIEAARLADMNITAILEEPVAAALCYGSTAKKMDDEIILVYDFGGGTFDLTLITKSGDQLHVIAKDGVNKLGGKEFDEIVSTTIRNTYQKAFKEQFPIDKFSLNRLQKVAEKIKIELNDAEHPRNLQKWLMFGHEAFEVNFNYAEYSKQALDLIQKTEQAVNRCIRSLGLSFTDISKIILIGGTSSSKIVYNYWKDKIGPKQELVYHQPLSSVAKGAALYAASLNKDYSSQVRPIELKSVSTYNIGLRPVAAGGRVEQLIHRNTPLPVSAKKLYQVKPLHDHLIELELCQFWDETDIQSMGIIRVGPFNTFNDFMLEVNVENRLNGTISIKVKNADSGKDIKFEFIKKQSDYKYDFHQQKNLVEGVYLNNYL